MKLNTSQKNAEDILATGVREPLALALDDDKVWNLDGHHRVVIALQQDLSYLPVKRSSLRRASANSPVRVFADELWQLLGVPVVSSSPRRCTYCLVDACDKCQGRGCSCGHVKYQRKRMAKPKHSQVTLKFVWGDLPGDPRGGVKTAERFEPAMHRLKEEPGRWAIIAEYPSHGGASAAIRALRKAGFTSYDYATRRADTEDDGYNLWASYAPKSQARSDVA